MIEVARMATMMPGERLTGDLGHSGTIAFSASFPRGVLPAPYWHMVTLINAWNEAHREFAIALDNLPDEDLWKRAHPRLLSVGELAGHIAYWEAVWTHGDGQPAPDLATLPIQSPFLDRALRYYPVTVDEPVQLAMGTAETLVEVARVHKLAIEALAGKEIDTPFESQWRTWGNFVQYQGFHVAYHTGQAYSVRHLRGHETEDN